MRQIESWAPAALFPEILKAPSGPWGHAERAAFGKDTPQLGVDGTVEVYNRMHSIGFVSPGRDAKNGFGHATSLDRSGMGSLDGGHSL